MNTENLSKEELQKAIEDVQNVLEAIYEDGSMNRYRAFFEQLYEWRCSATRLAVLEREYTRFHMNAEEIYARFQKRCADLERQNEAATARDAKDKTINELNDQLRTVKQKLEQVRLNASTKDNDIVKAQAAERAAKDAQAKAESQLANLQALNAELQTFKQKALERLKDMHEVSARRREAREKKAMQEMGAATFGGSRSIPPLPGNSYSSDAFSRKPKSDDGIDDLLKLADAIDKNQAEAKRQREEAERLKREAGEQRQREEAERRQREAEAQRQREAEEQRQREEAAQRQREEEERRNRLSKGVRISTDPETLKQYTHLNFMDFSSDLIGNLRISSAIARRAKLVVINGKAYPNPLIFAQCLKCNGASSQLEPLWKIFDPKPQKPAPDEQVILLDMTPAQLNMGSTVTLAAKGSLTVR